MMLVYGPTLFDRTGHPPTQNPRTDMGRIFHSFRCAEDRRTKRSPNHASLLQAEGMAEAPVTIMEKGYLANDD